MRSPWGLRPGSGRAADIARCVEDCGGDRLEGVAQSRLHGAGGDLVRRPQRQPHAGAHRRVRSASLRPLAATLFWALRNCHDRVVDLARPRVALAAGRRQGPRVPGPRRRQQRCGLLLLTLAVIPLLVLLEIPGTVATKSNENNSVIFAKGTTVGAITFQGFRIPTLTRLKNGSLLASAEARYGHDGARNEYPSSIVTRLSMDSAGEEWGPYSTLQAATGVNYGNVMMISDLVTGEVFVFFCHNNQDLFLTSTKDGGATWAGKKNMTATLKPQRGGVGSEWLGAGPSAGLQIPSTGRLLGACNSKVNGTDKEFLIISDDHGSTWRRSAFVPQGVAAGLREAAVALSDGGKGLTMLVRASDKAGTYHHFASTSKTFGDSWAPATPAMAAADSPSCADSVISVYNHSVTVGVAPFGKLRQNLTLFHSGTWTAEQSLYPYCAAYSSMANGLNDGDVMLLFEGVFDDPSFSCAKGGSSVYSIAVTSFHVSKMKHDDNEATPVAALHLSLSAWAA